MSVRDPPIIRSLANAIAYASQIGPAHSRRQFTFC